MEIYEIYAVKYAERDAVAGDHYLRCDDHNTPAPMDYFIWVLRNENRTIVVDIGFDALEAKKRHRRHLRCPAVALELLNVNADAVSDVIVTHLHYDHVGNLEKFPSACFHLQDNEMCYATGRAMRHQTARAAYTAQHITDMIHAVYNERVVFHDGAVVLFPGVSLHLIGGHTRGMQAVRVNTKRGWVVLASDAAHFLGNLVHNNPFTIVDSVTDMLEGFEKLESLATSREHIIPGHDPLVMAHYPSPKPETDGIIVRLDEPPTTSMVDAAKRL